jgi:hypothetical protein
MCTWTVWRAGTNTGSDALDELYEFRTWRKRGLISYCPRNNIITGSNNSTDLFTFLSLPVVHEWVLAHFLKKKKTIHVCKLQYVLLCVHTYIWIICEIMWVCMRCVLIYLGIIMWPIPVAMLSKQSLDCWNCGFESLWGHGYTCIVFVVSTLGSGCDGLIGRSEESYRLRVCVCVCVRACVWSRNLRTERPTAELGCCDTEKGKMYILFLEVGISVLNGKCLQRKYFYLLRLHYKQALLYIYRNQ